MSDFFVAIGLVFAIEGLIFAAFPARTKGAVKSVLETPDHVLRVIGITCATFGVVMIWLVRG